MPKCLILICRDLLQSVDSVSPHLSCQNNHRQTQHLSKPIHVYHGNRTFFIIKEQFFVKNVNVLGIYMLSSENFFLKMLLKGLPKKAKGNTAASSTANLRYFHFIATFIKKILYILDNDCTVTFSL